MQSGQFDEIKELYESNSLLSHVWVLFVVFLAHVAADMKRIETGEKRFSFYVFCLRMISSCFIGFTTFYTCLHFDIDTYLIGSIVGMATYGGIDGINTLIKVIAGKYKLSFTVEETKKEQEKIDV